VGGPGERVLGGGLGQLEVLFGAEGVALRELDLRELEVRFGDREIARRAGFGVGLAGRLHVGGHALGPLAKGRAGRAAEREQDAGEPPQCCSPGSTGFLSFGLFSAGFSGGTGGGVGVRAGAVGSAGCCTVAVGVGGPVADVRRSAALRVAASAYLSASDPR